MYVLREFFIKSKVRKLILFIFLILFFVGINFELEILLIPELDYMDIMKNFFNVSVTTIYIIPIVLFIVMISKKAEINLIVIPLTLLSSLFTTGWIAGFANNFLAQLLPEFLSNWESAIVAPLSEETLKIALAIFILYILKIRDVKYYLIAGLCSGLAFQITEDSGMILAPDKKNLIDGLYVAFQRSSESLSSHWVFTGIAMVGIGYFLYEHNKLYGVYLITFSYLFHFLWNSPIQFSSSNFFTFQSLLSAVIVFQFLIVLKGWLKLYTNEKVPVLLQS